MSSAIVSSRETVCDYWYGNVGSIDAAVQFVFSEHAPVRRLN
jgi:hypothetical protein